VTDTLSPWCVKIQNQIKMKLIRITTQKCEFDLFQVTKGDMDTRAKYFLARMATGSITPNRILEMEGEAAYSGGDRYYIGTNNYTPADRQDEIIDAQIKSKEPKEEPKETESEKQSKEIATKLNQKALAFIERV